MTVDPIPASHYQQSTVSVQQANGNHPVSQSVHTPPCFYVHDLWLKFRNVHPINKYKYDSMLEHQASPDVYTYVPDVQATYNLASTFIKHDIRLTVDPRRGHLTLRQSE